ncbi:MAG: hypothetical protein DRI92_06000, partial [Aquificota bacterium]
SDPNYIDFGAFVVEDVISVTGVTRGYDYSGVVRRQILPRGPADMAEFPRVISTDPADAAVGVDLDSDIRATFNMTVTNVDTGTFVLEGPTGPVTGTVTYDAATMTAIFTPTTSLDLDTVYTATLSRSIQNESGETMWTDYVWTFHTVSAIELVVEKTGPMQVTSGQSLVYTITLQTSGWLSAANVVVTDTLPVSVTYVSDNSGITPSNPVSGTYVWSLGDLSSNVTFTFRLTTTVNSGVKNETLITNTVQAGTDTPGDDPANNRAEVQATAYELITIAEARQRSDGEIVAVRGYVNFPTGLLHSAGASRDEFMIQDAPLGSTGIDVFYNGAKFTTLHEGEQVIVVGELDEFRGKREIIPADPSDVYPQGSTATLTPVVTDTGAITETTEGVLVEITGEVLSASSSSLSVDDGSGAAKVYRDFDTGISLDEFTTGDYVRVVGVSSQYDSSAPYTEGYQVMPRFQSDLTEFPRVISTDPANAAVGVDPDGDIRATFNMTVTNVDTSTFVLEGPTGPVTGAVTYDTATMTAIFTPTTSLDFETVYTATLFESIQNESSETMWTDYVWSFETASMVDLSVSKDGPTVAISGESVVYTITLQTTGRLSATNVVLTDVLPISTTFVAQSNTCSATCNAVPGATDTITWDVGTVLSNTTCAVYLTVTLDSGIANGSLVTNTAIVTTDTEADNPTNNQAKAQMTVYELITIAEARQRSNGETVLVEGTVTAEPGVFVDFGTNRKMYIEDSTAGILIYRHNGLAPVARNNRVRVLGSLGEYRTERELIPSSPDDITDYGADTPVSPVLTDTGAISESLEGQLVQIIGQVVAKPQNYSLVVDDGSGPVEVYQYYNLGQPSDPNYIDFGAFVVEDVISVTGVTRGYDYSGVVRRQILPRG